MKEATANVNENVDDKDLTWATVNLGDEEEVARFEELELRRAGERIKKAVDELQNLGIIDEQGELMNSELPPDMEPDSKCDL